MTSAPPDLPTEVTEEKMLQSGIESLESLLLYLQHNVTLLTEYIERGSGGEENLLGGVEFGARHGREVCDGSMGMTTGSSVAVSGVSRNLDHCTHQSVVRSTINPLHYTNKATESNLSIHQSSTLPSLNASAYPTTATDISNHDMHRLDTSPSTRGLHNTYHTTQPNDPLDPFNVSSLSEGDVAYISYSSLGAALSDAVGLSDAALYCELTRRVEVDKCGGYCNNAMHVKCGSVEQHILGRKSTEIGTDVQCGEAGMVNCHGSNSDVPVTSECLNINPESDVAKRHLSETERRTNNNECAVGGGGGMKIGMGKQRQTLRNEREVLQTEAQLQQQLRWLLHQQFPRCKLIVDQVEW